MQGRKSLRVGVAALFVLAGMGTAFAQGDAQNPYPQQPPPGQYPPADQQQQYPPPGQYPQTQQHQQYPPPQQEYPQQQYPEQQGQPPAPYPAQQAPYPPQPNAPGEYPQQPAPPVMAPQQLDQLVEPIALYPDGLLAQVLTASTFSNEIPDAAAWANQHSYLHGDQLAAAIQEDNLPWDPSVLALLPFPQVLNYMAQYPGWTQTLGNAVLSQRGDVMDAVQRMRDEAYRYGYLRSNQYVNVVAPGPGNIEILPVSPGYYYVPYYNPYVVFARPRPGFFVGGAIRFGPGIVIGAGFAPFGWGHVGFGWHDHAILLDGRPWDRTWVNRRVYVHPYAEPRGRVEGPRVERHDVHRDERHDDHRDERRDDRNRR